MPGRRGQLSRCRVRLLQPRYREVADRLQEPAANEPADSSRPGNLDRAVRLSYNPAPMNRFSRLTLVLVACLLLGQLAELVHASDVAAHEDGTTCNLCLSSQTHGHASAFPDSGLSRLFTHERTPVIVLAQHDLSTHFRYLSRAPPRKS